MADLNALFPQNTTAEDALIVDVGGGRGRILDNLRKARPDLKGRMIVQDLSQEIDGRNPETDVEGLSHDFFTPNPIKGAHTYFFRHIFHDWSDTESRQILQATISAMKPGYSRIVISDAVVGDVVANSFMGLLDANMMAIGGTERTVRRWHELLESVGLKITQIKENPPLAECGFVEAVLA